MYLVAACYSHYRTNVHDAVFPGLIERGKTVPIESASLAHFNRRECFIPGSGVRNSSCQALGFGQLNPKRAPLFNRQTEPHSKDELAMPPKLFGPDEWKRIVRTLDLSPPWCCKV